MPQPTNPAIQIVPWLAQPLSPLLWVAFGGALLVALLMLTRVRRSPQPLPVSLRWLAVGVVVTVGLFAAMSYGAQLAHPLALYTAPVFALVSVAVAAFAWHADGDSRRATKATVFAVASASVLSTGGVLLCAWLLKLATRSAAYDLDLGPGVGEAVGHLLPALAAAALPLALIPPAHPRSAAVRRAVTLHIGFLVLTIGSTVAASAVAMTTPLPLESPLSDRYLYVNALVVLPAMLASLCACGTAVFAGRSGLPGFLRFAGIVGLSFLVLWLCAGSATLKSAFRFDWWRPAACLSIGLLVGFLLAGRACGWRIVTFVTTLTAVGVCAMACKWLAGSSPSGYTPLMMKGIVFMGLLAACALTPVRPMEHEPGERSTLSLPLSTACLAIGLMLTLTMTLRSQLTFQADRYSKGYDYSASHQTDPEMRTIIQQSLHALSMSGSGERWAWVVPQSTWWTRDGAWRDALIVTDHAQEGLATPVTAGTYYRARVIDADRKLSEESFMETPYVGLIEPAPRGQRSAVVYTVAVRKATPEQLSQWAGVKYSNLRVWVGLALALPFAWWASRSNRTVAAVCLASGVLILLLTSLLGAASVSGLITGSTILLLLVSTRRDDGWRAPVAVIALLLVAIALKAVTLPLGG